MTLRQHRPIRARSVQGNLQTPDPPRDAFPFRMRILDDGTPARTVSERFGKPEEVAKYISAVWVLRKGNTLVWMIQIWDRDTGLWRDLNHVETWLMKTLIEGMGGRYE